MTITDRILTLDPTLKIHNEGFWQEPFDKDKKGFSSFNDAGIECETGEFLYSLARLLKPDNILETGTHWGVGASYLGFAVKDNKHGHVETIEFLPEIHLVAQDRINRIGLNEFVTCHYGDVAKFKTDKMYKLILLDTEPQTRFKELEQFYNNLEEGGFIFIHDLHQHMNQVENLEHGYAWPYGKIRPRLRQLVREDYLRPIHFSTPRGLTGFYKVHSKDYDWNAKI